MSTLHQTRRIVAARQKGVASIEFAIGMIVILVLMLVSAEVGRLYFSYHSATKAVRSGSRFLSNVAMNSASVVELTAESKQLTRNLVVTGQPGGNGQSVVDGLKHQNVHIGKFTQTGSARQYIEVRAVFTYEPMLGVIFGLGRSHNFGITMVAASTMRVLR